MPCSTLSKLETIETQDFFANWNNWNKWNNTFKKGSDKGVQHRVYTVYRGI
nr:MAG TPA: hypothetical protein [Caudoviricetes sp.]